MAAKTSSLNPVDNDDSSLFEVQTNAEGPTGSLPLDEEFLRNAPSGDIFGLTQDAGMGWNPLRLRNPEFLILSTQGGIRAPDGTPVALGYHTGHWEVGLLMEAAAARLKALGMVPFAGFVTDPCDGRSQGTTGMMDSLPYRNDAAIVLRRLIRSLPTRKGVMGVATCDKGLPAMMLALAAQLRARSVDLHDDRRMRQAELFSEDHPSLAKARIVRLQAGQDEVVLFPTDGCGKRGGSRVSVGFDKAIVFDVDASVGPLGERFAQRGGGPRRAGGHGHHLSPVLFLEPQRLFERVGVRLVHLEGQAIVAHPCRALVKADHGVPRHDLLNADKDIHGAEGSAASMPPKQQF